MIAFGISLKGTRGRVMVWWFLTGISSKIHLFLHCGCCSVTKSCLTLQPMDFSTPCFPVLHYLPEFAQIHVQASDAKAEAPKPRPPDSKNWLIGKDPDVGKDWGREEKKATEDEMVGWHHWLKGHESEQTLGDSEGQGSLACCRPRGHKELDTTERLNNNSNSEGTQSPEHSGGTSCGI